MESLKETPLEVVYGLKDTNTSALVELSLNLKSSAEQMCQGKPGQAPAPRRERTRAQLSMQGGKCLFGVQHRAPKCSLRKTLACISRDIYSGQLPHPSSVPSPHPLLHQTAQTETILIVRWRRETRKCRESHNQIAEKNLNFRAW